MYNIIMVSFRVIFHSDVMLSRPKKNRLLLRLDRQARYVSKKLRPMDTTGGVPPKSRSGETQQTLHSVLHKRLAKIKITPVKIKRLRVYPTPSIWEHPPSRNPERAKRAGYF